MIHIAIDEREYAGAIMAGYQKINKSRRFQTVRWKFLLLFSLSAALYMVGCRTSSPSVDELAPRRDGSSRLSIHEFASNEDSGDVSLKWQIGRAHV